MFTTDPTIVDLKIKERDLYKAIFSMNFHQVATPELGVDEARYYIFFFREEDKYSAYIVLYMPNSERRAYYTYSSNPFPEADLPTVIDIARAFGEDMGFFLDEKSFASSSVAEKNLWIDEQPLFGYKTPEELELAEAMRQSATAAAPEPEAEQSPAPEVAVEKGANTNAEESAPPVGRLVSTEPQNEPVSIWPVAQPEPARPVPATPPPVLVTQPAQPAPAAPVQQPEPAQSVLVTPPPVPVQPEAKPAPVAPVYQPAPAQSAPAKPAPKPPTAQPAPARSVPATPPPVPVPPAAQPSPAAPVHQQGPAQPVRTAPPAVPAYHQPAPAAAVAQTPPAPIQHAEIEIEPQVEVEVEVDTRPQRQKSSAVPRPSTERTKAAGAVPKTGRQAPANPPEGEPHATPKTAAPKPPLKKEPGGAIGVVGRELEALARLMASF